MTSPFDPCLDADLPADPRPYLGPCDCHLRNDARTVPGERGGNTPNPACPKCHGEGEIFGTVAA